MTARAAQITLLCIAIALSLPMVGLFGYITSIVYGDGGEGGYTALGANGGPVDVGGTHKTYLTTGYRYGYDLITTTMRTYKLVTTTSYDYYTRLDGSVRTYTYERFTQSSYLTTFVTNDYGYHMATFTTYGLAFRRDGGGGAIGPTPTAEISQPTASVAQPSPTVDPAQPTAPPTQPTAPPDRRDAPDANEMRRYYMVAAAEAEMAKENAKLEKRRGRVKIGGGGGGDGPSLETKKAVYPVLLVFGILTAIWAIVTLIVSAVKPTSKFVSVNAELIMAFILFAIGAGSTVAYTAYSQGQWGGAIFGTAMILSWVLTALLLGYMLFLFIHTNRFYGGKEGRKKSFATLVGDARKAELQSMYGGGVPSPPEKDDSSNSTGGPPLMSAPAGMRPGGYYTPGAVPPGSAPGTQPPMYYVPPGGQPQPFAPQHTSGSDTTAYNPSQSQLAPTPGSYGTPSFGPSAPASPPPGSIAPLAPQPSHSPTPPAHQAPYDVVQYNVNANGSGYAQPHAQPQPGTYADPNAAQSHQYTQPAPYEHQQPASYLQQHSQQPYTPGYVSQPHA